MTRTQAKLSLVAAAIAAGTAVLVLGAGGLSFSSRRPVRVRLGRFAGPEAVELPPAAGSVEIPIPPDRSPRPWIAELAIGAPTRVCGIR